MEDFRAVSPSILESGSSSRNSAGSLSWTYDCVEKKTMDELEVLLPGPY